MDGNQRHRVERLTPTDGQYFFGYYDVAAWSADESHHLCHRVAFQDRLPEPTDVAVLGMIGMKDKQFTPLAETTAWNFQQGSMLQWNPAAPNDEVIFNRREGEAFVGVVKNVWSGAERILSRPVAAVSPAGDYAASINFSRLLNYRPGYGYAGIRDPFGSELHPSEDGVFQVDLKTGESRLIVSLLDIYRACPESVAGQKLLVNHVSFNTNGTRLVFLARNDRVSNIGTLKTAIFTVGPGGEDLYCLQDYGMASHYHWRDPEHLLCYCDAGTDRHTLYLLQDRSERHEALNTEFFRFDGHCSYSPDRKSLLYDSYPSYERMRRLLIYDLATRQGRTLGEFYSPQEANADIRTDLHPRWSPSGRAVSFDSTHEGFRGVYTMDLLE